MSGCLDGWTFAATLPARGTLRQRDPPLGAGLLAGEPVALVGGERGEVDRGLRIGRQHHERLARADLRQRAAGAYQRQRAVQAACVEGSYDPRMIAAFLESGELQRLYTGLSLLVSAATDGRPARALVGFGALAPLLDERLLARALRPDAAPDVAETGREAFARTLAELRDTAIELEDCRIWACAAAVEATGTDRALVEARLDGVLSTPRFLREVAGADLVVV
jgi:peroxiredoxin family protein